MEDIVMVFKTNEKYQEVEKRKTSLLGYQYY